MEAILERVIKTIEDFQMLSPGERVVVGVSGGPDSIALLHILYSLKDKWNLSLVVAHLNHLLRGKESEEDAIFVSEFARALELPCYVETQDVRSFMKQEKRSLQEAARLLRYRFFARVAHKTGAQKIGVGQNADDQIETFILNLLRGSGLTGLGAIPFQRPLTSSELEGKENHNLLVIRPLLNIHRKEIEGYLSEKGISFREDSSNIKPIYLRNRIRQELLPLLTKYNPAIKEILLQTIQILQQEENYRLVVINQIWPQLTTSEPSKISLHKQKFLRLPLLLQRRLLREAIFRIKGDLHGIEFRHIEEIIKMAQCGNTGTSINLPQGLTVKKDYQTLVIFHQTKSSAVSYEKVLLVPGTTSVPEIGISVTCSLLTPTKDTICSKNKMAWFDYHKLKLPLWIRNRREGDYFQPLGMEGTQKLKKFFIDHKISRDQRQCLSLIVAGDDIIWVTGWRISEKVKVTSKTQIVLQIEIKEDTTQ